jgi:hypothetical protein
MAVTVGTAPVAESTVNPPVTETPPIPISVAVVGVVAVPVQHVATVFVKLAPNQLVVPLITHLFEAGVNLALVTATACAAEKLVISTLARVDVRAGVEELSTL